MAVVRLDRFTVDPGDVEQLLARRNALVTAVRDAVPGLIEAGLAKLDDQTWIDLWHWDSRASAQAAIERARAGASRRRRRSRSPRISPRSSPTSMSADLRALALWRGSERT
jgi:heme-degrading monooxygenase HmoA